MRSIAYFMKGLTDDHGEDSFRLDLHPEVRFQRFMKRMGD